MLLLFGDNCVDFHASIVELYTRSKTSVVLRSLLLACSEALPCSLSELSAAERAYFGHFDSLLELSELFSHRPEEEKDTAVATVLQCACQIGWLLIQMETENGPTVSDLERRSTGIGTGMLLAVVAASVPSAMALLQVAPDVIGIALRLGIQASRRSRLLEAPSALSWSRQIEGVRSLSKELDAFHTSADVAQHRQLYASSSGQNTIIISGPPSVLQLFVDNNARLVQAHAVPARAAYHAPHLAPPPLDAIIGASAFLHILVPEHTLFSGSSSTDASSSPQTVGQVLERVILEIMSSPIRLDTVAHALQLFRPVPIGPIGQHILNPLGSSLRPNELSMSALYSLPAPKSQRFGSNDIAIVGISGRFPGGDDLESFWDVLSSGQDLHRKIPSNRFDLATHFDPTGSLKNSTATPYGCFLDGPDLFDARLFNMSPREAAQTDPMARIFLMTVHEALEMSGYQYDRTHATAHKKIAVYFGQTSDDYREVNASQNVDTFWVTAGNRMFANGRVSYHYGWEGQSMNVDGACSSSHLAIQLACSALVSRECDTAVAGGGMVITNPDVYAGLDRGGFLSHTGSCKPLDSQADGYCRAEAVGTLILKRLEDAISDRDNIQAVIKSISTNHSAEARSITHPHAGTQERLMRKVLRDAALTPGDINYIEMHGTGTQAGDLQETTSIASVFGDNRDFNSPLYVGALKANVGHSESASGVSAVIKSILMLQKSTIPRHVGIKSTINPKLPPLESMNIRIPMENTPFRPGNGEGDKRRIIVNNFNAAGGNTCLLLEDVPHTIVTGSDPRASQIVTISARTSKSLTQNLRNMVRYLETNGDARLCDVAYTTTARRMHHSLRTSYVASSTAELITSLKKDIDRCAQLNSTKTPPVVFIFTGQGSLFAGMGHQLYNVSSVFRESICSSESMCRHLGFPSFINLIKDPSIRADQYTPVQAQLGQAALQLALATAWISWGVKPTAVIGHSLGEYVALCLAEVLSVTDMFYLIGHRALLMQSKCREGSHSMLAVAMDEHDARQAITDARLNSCEIACLNGPNSTTVTGPTVELNSLHEELIRRHIKSSLLRVPYAYHSVQVQEIVAEYELIARQVHYDTPKINVVSTLLGQTVKERGVFGAQYLARQARETVDFLGAVKECYEHGVARQDAVWIEIGPRPTCTTMVQSILGISPNRLISSMHPTEDQWLTLSLGLAETYRSGVDIDWNRFHKEYETSLQLLDLPKYAFDLKSHWIQYEGDWNRTKASSNQSAKAAEPPFSSTTLQRIESEVSSKGQRTVTFLSDLEEPNLMATLQGHRVDDWALCPSSVYADMAYSAASYIWKQSHPDTEVPGINVSGMSIHSPIVLREQTNQQVRITAVHDEASTMVRITYGLSSSNDSSAECSVFYEDYKQWESDWKEQAYFVQSVAERLAVQGVNHGTTERIFRKTAYRIFSRLVDYAPSYQGMADVYLDGDNLEGYAKIKLQPQPAGANFGMSPYWIDSLGHLSGFVVNASSDRTQVYISEGFDNMRLLAPLSESNTYHSYVRMIPTGKPGWVAGNVYILQDSKIVGVIQGVKFRAMSKKVLEIVMGSQPAKHTNAPPAQTAKIAQPLSTSYLPASPPAEDVLTLVDSCLCSETGVSLSEISDATRLPDIGVDSLLTMSLVATLRERADLNISTSDFMAFDTVGDLRQYVRKMTFTPAETGRNTPALVSTSMAANVISAASPVPAFELPIIMSAIQAPDILKSIIVNELGLEDEEVRADEYLEELGLDSLMSMAVLHVYKQKAGIELPASFFLEHPTLAAANKALSSAATLPVLTSYASPVPPVMHSPRATSINLQLASSTTAMTTSTLFLLPDGSGSASSYLSLKLPSSISVVALNSPFLRNPDAFSSDLHTVAQLFVDEILARQPDGEYLLGGWSMGAAYAYEAANLLVTMGKHVNGIIMIDPCPLNRRPMNAQTLAILDQVGVFSELGQTNAATKAIIQRHFEASTRILASYSPAPRCADFAVLVVSASDGVLQRLGMKKAQEVWDRYREQSGEDEAWLFLAREGDRTHGWATMFDSVIEVNIGGDHFSIMKPGQVQGLNEALGSFCTRFVSA